MPGHTFGFVKLLASSDLHYTKWVDEQHRPAGLESRLVPDLPLPYIPTLIGLRAFEHVSSHVWWEAATNKQKSDPVIFIPRILFCWAGRSYSSAEEYSRCILSLTDKAGLFFFLFFFYLEKNVFIFWWIVERRKKKKWKDS